MIKCISVSAEWHIFDEQKDGWTDVAVWSFRILNYIKVLLSLSEPDSGFSSLLHNV